VADRVPDYPATRGGLVDWFREVIDSRDWWVYATDDPGAGVKLARARATLGLVGYPDDAVAAATCRLVVANLARTLDITLLALRKAEAPAEWAIALAHVLGVSADRTFGPDQDMVGISEDPVLLICGLDQIRRERVTDRPPGDN
jgi:hypothetical protein